MKKKESAAFYQEHQDDPELWGDLEEAPAPTRHRPTGLGVSITVRFTANEAEAIRRTAKQEGVTYSDIVRKSVLRYVRPNQTFETSKDYTLPVFQSRSPITEAHRNGALIWERSPRSETRSSAAPNLPNGTAADH